ncbi:MAG: hypothetical protein KME45_08070 [Stenomitos rutilans HA7619-LM2]|jgi:quinol-cytochrome oxidoreductase complex cytochrome b subunit|nr:hypothetical protein [Stenomitos rutilans HA7619-LM2]
MLIAKLLLVISLLVVYLAACFFLLADSFPPVCGMLFVALHAIYSWCIIWFYAYLKVQNGGNLVYLLIPILSTTSTLGIAIWLIFRPEATLRKRFQR